MTDRDSFLREVDEAVRREQYRRLWDKYGLYIIALIGLLIVGVAAYRGWSYWNEKRSQEAGDEFTQALTLTDDGKTAKAREAFEKLSKDGPEGYRVLARFQLAAADAKVGETDEAIAAYDALSTDSGVDRILQDLAVIQGSMLRLDKADFAEMERRVKGLVDSKSAWRFSARELLGFSAYRQKNMNEAERQFSALLGDPATPPNLRERANMMLALIVGGDPQALSTTEK
ncbi:MAG: tetratricopeptide repeat protein [Methyloceanibacter sp.]